MLFTLLCLGEGLLLRMVNWYSGWYYDNLQTLVEYIFITNASYKSVLWEDKELQEGYIIGKSCGKCYKK